MQYSRYTMACKVRSCCGMNFPSHSPLYAHLQQTPDRSGHKIAPCLPTSSPSSSCEGALHQKSRSTTEPLHYPVASLFWPLHSLFIGKGLQRSSSASSGTTYMTASLTSLSLCLSQGFPSILVVFSILPPLSLHVRLSLTQLLLSLRFFFSFLWKLPVHCKCMWSWLDWPWKGQSSHAWPLFKGREGHGCHRAAPWALMSD